jgi:hypothetical protein
MFYIKYIIIHELLNYSITQLLNYSITQLQNRNYLLDEFDEIIIITLTTLTTVIRTTYKCHHICIAYTFLLVL